jgi:hypothetical protein
MSISTATNVYPIGLTFVIAASNTSAQTYVTTNNTSITAIMVENLDATNDVYVNWSTTAPSVTAVVPSTGTATQGLAVQANNNKVINIAPVGGTFNGNITVAANAITGTATVLITPVI